MSSSSTSNEIAAWVRDVVASAKSTPEETEIYFEKLTGLSEFDELGADFETLLDGSLKITSIDSCNVSQIAIWNEKHPDKSVRVGDVITCVNGIGTDDSDRMRNMLYSERALRLTVRCGGRHGVWNWTAASLLTETRTSNVIDAPGHSDERDAKLPRVESEVQLLKLNEIAANYKVNHSRIPDLSADIRIVFATEEYIGKYLSHGKTKTVFVIKRTGHKVGRFDGNILKMRL